MVVLGGKSKGCSSEAGLSFLCGSGSGSLEQITRGYMSEEERAVKIGLANCSKMCRALAVLAQCGNAA